MSNYIGVFKVLSESLEQADKVFAAWWSLYIIRKRQSHLCSPMANYCSTNFISKKNIQIELFLKELLRDILNAYTVNLRGTMDGYFTFKDMTENLQKKCLSSINLYQREILKYSVISFSLCFYTYLTKFYWSNLAVCEIFSWKIFLHST